MPTARPAPELVARDLRDAPAIPADPRPGTRPLDQTALGALGIELLHCGPDHVAVRVALPAHAGGGFGPLLVAAETAASTAANLRCGPEQRAFGAELDAASLTPDAASTRAVVVATELAIHEDRHVWRITAWGDDDQQLLEARCTLGVVAAPRD
ncbi:MAG: hypothetical protein KDC46_01390 [Thermoleophilia bacterium]|nr:hypothetical protein [Thermoleophilia bacterium]